MTPYQVWERNVTERPQDFQMGEDLWKDKIIGWECWVGNGLLSYHLISPCGGEISISWSEKFKMKRLINWWAEGALSQPVALKERGPIDGHT